MPSGLALQVLQNAQCLPISSHILLGHGGTEHLRAEEGSLRPLDHLLVHAHRRVVHDDCAGLVVDLGVDARVADQVDDPLLALVLAQAEAGGEVPSITLAGWYKV